MEVITKVLAKEEPLGILPGNTSINPKPQTLLFLTGDPNGIWGSGCCCYRRLGFRVFWGFYA